MKFKVFFKKGNNELNYVIILNRLSIFLLVWDKFFCINIIMKVGFILMVVN